jgi:hypothetical protein
MCSTIVAATTTDYPRRHGEISIKNAYYLFHPIIHITCHPNESYESSFIIHHSSFTFIIGYRLSVWLDLLLHRKWREANGKVLRNGGKTSVAI